MNLFRKIWSGLVRRLISGRPAEPLSSAPPSFLFLQYETPLGTAVISTATLVALRARRPDAHIAVATAGTPLNTLRACPYVDELIATPHAISQFPAALMFFLTRIRSRRFDYVLTDSGNPRGKVSVLALASAARNRVGVTLRPEFFHRALASDKSRSNIENNLQVLDALGLTGPTVDPEIHFTQGDLDKALTLLDGSAHSGPRIAMVTQTSKGHPNAWFDDDWIKLAGRLVEELDAGLVFLGTGRDQVEIDALRARIPRQTWSVAGLTDIPELAAVLTQCDLVITIDTGALHVARAVGTPSVVLANAAQPPNWWLPQGDDRFKILRKGYVPCALCLRFSCETRECMQEISVQEVFDNVVAQLGRYPPSAGVRSARALTRLSKAAPVREN